MNWMEELCELTVLLQKRTGRKWKVSKLLCVWLIINVRFSLCFSSWYYCFVREIYIYIYIFLEFVVFLLCPYSMGETVGYWLSLWTGRWDLLVQNLTRLSYCIHRGNAKCFSPPRRDTLGYLKLWEKSNRIHSGEGGNLQWTCITSKRRSNSPAQVQLKNCDKLLYLGAAWLR